MAKAEPELQPAATDDWQLPPVNDQGHQTDADGWPLNPVARAIALAEAGRKVDPAEIVTREAIAAQNPKGVAADLEAVAAYRLQRDWGEDATPDTFAAANVATAETAPTVPAADAGE